MSSAMSTAALRVGLVGPLPPPSGGMANQTLQLATLLRGEGIDVEMIQINRAYQPGWIANVKGIRAGFRLVPYLLHLWQAAARVDVFHVMANSGWSWHLFAAPAIWVGRLRGCPVVVNYRGGEAATFLAKSLASIRPSLNRADAVIVPSGFLEAVFGRHGFKTRIVPNIINLERFSASGSTDGAASATGQASPARLAPRMLVARNLEPIYDNATALQALAIVIKSAPDARLVIAGSGPLRSALEQLAAELGITHAVTFTGRVDNVAMADLYRNANVMINPSLVDNMPNSVLESLASGVPVVSTNVGGVPYLVEDGKTALLIPPQAPQAMADAILRLTNEPGLAAGLTAAGLQYVQQYSWQNVRPRLLGVYQSVLRTGTAKAVVNS
jgi:glycosyltransferase involved in cell wall biosynthesis